TPMPTRNSLNSKLLEEYPMMVDQTLLDSMPRRCQADNDAKGYPTKY
uniref:Uncharacterized protein n=1 Tax=Caenorhabditis japonica TaxID=281687 RepID=A0A8R1IWN0_CAEJA